MLGSDTMAGQQFLSNIVRSRSLGVFQDGQPQTGGADVVFYRIEGAGHTWPGGAFYQLLMGSVCNDIDASALIGTFCLAHTR